MEYMLVDCESVPAFALCIPAISLCILASVPPAMAL